MDESPGGIVLSHRSPLPNNRTWIESDTYDYAHQLCHAKDPFPDVAGLGTRMGVGYHIGIDYRKGCVNGKVCTKGIDGFWSFVKERLMRYYGVNPGIFPLFPKNNRSSDSTLVIAPWY
jgi:hypothetical protein